MTTPAGPAGPAPTSTTRGAHLPNASGFTKKQQQPKPPVNAPTKANKKKPAKKR